MGTAPHRAYKHQGTPTPMPTVRITPNKDKPVPFDLSEDKATNFQDEVAIAAATAELQVELGAPIEVRPEDYEREQRLLDAVIKNRDSRPLDRINTAYAAAAFLKTYGSQFALDAAVARNAITNKLMEIANCGETKFELKALELLGKHSDIGLFTERSEITINYKSPEALEEAIKERVKRLLNADLIDITPLGRNLDDELGVADLQPPIYKQPAPKTKFNAKLKPEDDNERTEPTPRREPPA